MVEASIGPTVLIHDATFDDSIHGGAIMNNHCTTKEALQVAQSSRVYRVILTHFSKCNSQCNPKISIFSDNYTSHACIAFDMMCKLGGFVVSTKVNILFKYEMLFDDDIDMVA